MKNFILLMVLVVCSFCLFGQVPGYIGKRHQFTYTPSVSIFNTKYRQKQDFGSHFYLSHQVGYDYAVAKRKTIGLFYDINITDFMVSSIYDNEYHDTEAKYTRHQIGFAYRIYKRNSPLAPLGGYWKYLLSVAKLKGELYPDIVAQLPIGTEYKYTDLDVMVGMGIGREFIIAKWVPLNLGIDFQLPIKSIAMAGGGTRSLETGVHSLTLANSLVKLNISIGILAF